MSCWRCRIADLVCKQILLVIFQLRVLLVGKKRNRSHLEPRVGEYVLKSLSQWLLLVAKRLLKKQLEKWFIVPVSESLQVLVIPFLSWDGHTFTFVLVLCFFYLQRNWCGNFPFISYHLIFGLGVWCLSNVGVGKGASIFVW